MTSDKEIILEKIRKGEVDIYKPGMRIPRQHYYKIVEKLQPATVSEVVEELRKRTNRDYKERGVKAILGRMLKKGELEAVIYKGEIYYLTKEKYQELREGKEQ